MVSRVRVHAHVRVHVRVHAHVHVRVRVHVRVHVVHVVTLLGAEDLAQCWERVALRHDELAMLVGDVALDVALVDQVREHTLDLVSVHDNTGSIETSFEYGHVELRSARRMERMDAAEEVAVGDGLRSLDEQV